MKCQSKEMGYLRDADNPSWTCNNESEVEMELKFKEGASIVKLDVCKHCAKSILHIIAEGKSAKLSFT